MPTYFLFVSRNDISFALNKYEKRQIKWSKQKQNEKKNLAKATRRIYWKDPISKENVEL